MGECLGLTDRELATHRAQESLAAGTQAGLFAPILEQAVDAVVIIDDRNEVVFFNAAAERLWGRGREDVIGRNVGMLVPAKLLRHHDGHIARNRNGASDRLVGTSVEVPVERPDGTVRHGSLSLSRVSIDGRIFYSAFVQDVTEEVRRREELYLLSLVANETDRAVLITDERHRIVYCNRAFSDMFGYGMDEVRGQSPTRLLAGRHTDPQVIERLNSLRHTQSGLNLEAMAYDKAGRELWIAVTINPIHDPAGTFRHAVSLISNITEARQMQLLQQVVLEALANDRDQTEIAELVCRQVERIAPGVVCSILRIDGEGRIRPLAAPSLPQAYSEALDGLPIGPDVGSCGTAAWRGEPVLVEDIETDPLWAPYKDLPLPLGLRACWSSPIKLKDGRVAGTFAFYFREKRGPSPWHERLVEACVHLCALALERHEAKERIAQLAYYDTLTGLPNRTLLGERIDEAIAAAGAEGSLALLFLDIDHFKDVNDSLGHSAGDGLLVEIAQRLKAQTRSGDLVSRLGGDEFVVLLSDCTADQAAGVAARIRQALAAPVTVEDMALPITASIGISLYPDDGRNRETLLKHADTAMYEAKSAGRGTHRFFSPAMNALAQERLVMGTALKEAVRDRQLWLAYQPQISGDGGAIHGLEALARWCHPAFGEVPPGRFIALAEEMGLVEDIGLWAIDEACAQLADWQRRGFAIPGVAINLSPLNFRNRDLPIHVAETLTRHGLRASALTLEITESIMMDDCPTTAATVGAIHDLGVRLSLDDFGTGYSSLSSITRLPIQEIKIDRSFMQGLETDRNAREVTSTVIRIGRSLGLTVVAEGVETTAQRRFLEALRCDVLQGFLFSPALPPAALENWLATRIALPGGRVANG